MELITDQTEARSSFASLFATWDAWEWPFQPGVEAATMLYPTDFHLEERYFEVVRAAAQDVGDSYIYVARVEAGPDFWTVDPKLEGGVLGGEMTDYASYLATRSAGLHTATWGAKGTWGILVNECDFAWVGGTREFVEALHRHYPQWREDRAVCRTDAENGGGLFKNGRTAPAWLGRLLPRLHGQEP